MGISAMQSETPSKFPRLSGCVIWSLVLSSETLDPALDGSRVAVKYVRIARFHDRMNRFPCGWNHLVCLLEHKDQIGKYALYAIFDRVPTLNLIFTWLFTSNSQAIDVDCNLNVRMMKTKTSSVSDISC